MTGIAEMMRKARVAVLRKGVPAEEADDLVHDAFIKLERFERDHAIRSREALLVRSAVNLSIDRARRLQRAPFSGGRPILDKVVDELPGPEQIAEARSELEHLNRGLLSLSEQTRRILLARRVEGRSYADIAEEEGLAIRSVEQRVARATLTLMKWMAE